MRFQPSLWKSMRQSATINIPVQFNIFHFFFRAIQNISTKGKHQNVLASRNLSTPSSPPTSTEQKNKNEPVKFFGSGAAAWQAKQGRTGTYNPETVPPIQMWSVLASVSIFLLYFCVFREENDIDREMEKSLYERVPGLEQTQLIINYKYNLENGMDNSMIITRMAELGIKPEDIAA